MIKLPPEREMNYEEERKLAQKIKITSNKPKLSRIVVVTVILLEFSAMAGMGYLIYRLYF